MRFSYLEKFNYRVALDHHLSVDLIFIDSKKHLILCHMINEKNYTTMEFEVISTTGYSVD